MAKHVHGSQNSDVHEKTFEGFVKGSAWVAIASIGILIFMAVFNS